MKKLKRKLIKWWYARQFTKAYSILRKESDRHKDAGHEVHFRAVNSSDIHLSCINCVELHPLKRRPEDVVHVTRDRYGHPYQN